MLTKAKTPIEVTLSGIVIELKPEPTNAPIPIVVSPSGNEIEVKSLV